MKCPVCSSQLKRSQYEGLPVFVCEGCDGYLVATRRVDEIKSRRVKSPEELAEEAVAGDGTDSQDRLRCPRCRRRMDKEFRQGSESFHIDRCQDCDLVWFDAGELAQLQLDHEATPLAQEAARLQDRHRQMTPEEKQEFERRLALLPEGDSSLASAFGEGLVQSMGGLAWSLRHRR